MAKTITDVLKEQTKDILSEETLSEIETVFNEAIEAKAQLQVEAALVQQDEDHAAKVQELLEAIDNDHTAKLERIVEAIDNDRAMKLAAVVQKYEDALNEGADTFKEGVITKISDYLDLYLEETFPQEMLEEAVNNKRAGNVLAEVRQLLGVDMALAKETIKEAVLDGKLQIDEASQELTTAKEENAVLAEKVTKLEAALVLEQKTRDLDQEKANYAQKVLGDKPAEFILENFDYTMKLFDKEATRELEVLREEASITTTDVDRPIVESTEPTSQPVAEEKADPMFNHYMGELGKY
tara:strand:- start:396 stop:1283 length:888 start_codon:yes stop_codon:yes gene_type:complete